MSMKRRYFQEHERRGRRWSVRRRLLELDMLERRLNLSAVIYTPTTTTDFPVGSVGGREPRNRPDHVGGRDGPGHAPLGHPRRQRQRGADPSTSRAAVLIG